MTAVVTDILLTVATFSGVTRLWCEGAQNYMKVFVAHRMMKNNTLNRVHVAATELPQLL